MIKVGILIFAIFLIFVLFCFLGCAQLGRNPSGARLEKIEHSSNYKNNRFQNELDTPIMSSDKSTIGAFWDFATEDRNKLMPEKEIPSIKTNLMKLASSENVLIWFGHSSFFLQVDGKKILVDPVLNGYAAPFSFAGKSFKGADIYSTNEIPDIDYLFISHDHYDHLDFETINQLKSRVKKFICGLGVGEHLERWGIDSAKILEGDWGDTFLLDRGFKTSVLSARHYSGRGLSKNKTLWVSFSLKTPSLNLYLGGDSGYGPHFERIGKSHGPFDMAFLESGQYNKDWKYIHMMPEETMQAAQDLGASRLMPIHSSKFLLARHVWNEPLERLVKLDVQGILATPMIGEKVNLDNPDQKFSHWW